MSPTSFLLNLLWIVVGGLWMAIGWVIAGVIMAITIIGLPWTRAAFNIASYDIATLRPEGSVDAPNILAAKISVPDRLVFSAMSCG